MFVEILFCEFSRYRWTFVTVYGAVMIDSEGGGSNAAVVLRETAAVAAAWLSVVD